MRCERRGWWAEQVVFFLDVWQREPREDILLCLGLLKVTFSK